MNSRKLVPVLVLLFSSPHAHAACPFVEAAFTHKMKEYRAYRESNQKSYVSLLARETLCKETGAKVSKSIATAAEARSCEAQADASRMNGELKKIGFDCEENFMKLNALQVDLRTAFNVVQDDLEAAMEIMESSGNLKSYCPRELELGRKMVKAFLKLEGDIVVVEHRSLAGKEDYGKFKDAAAQLQAVTAATNRNCGELAHNNLPAARAVSATYAAGSAASPRGVSRNPASDISGTDNAIREAREAAAATR